MNLFGYIKNTLKRYFVSGILVIVPMVVTYLVLLFLLTSIDGILSPLVMKVFGYTVPGLGILVSILLIMLAGILTRGVVGGRLVYYWEKFLHALPLVRTIYSPAKQLILSIAGPQTEKFNRVVVIPYPRQGVYSLAFAAEEVDLTGRGIEGEFVSVFIPSTPTPFTGFVVMVNKEDLHPIDITIEEAIKFLVSGGIAVPDKLLPEGIRNQQII
jgi:uncharacterized membrane protein